MTYQGHPQTSGVDDMQSVDAIIQAHEREMKSLRKAIALSQKNLREDRSRQKTALKTLKQQIAFHSQPHHQPSPLAARIFSMLF